MAEEEHAPRWRIREGQRNRARTLRSGSTDAEQILWFELRAHRLQGLSFRRQHPIGPYIVDFACLPCRLVVELDGGQHFEEAGRAKDERRDQALAEKGFLTLRFSNLDVLKTLEGVLETIASSAHACRPPPNPPPPELGASQVRFSKGPKSEKSDFGAGEGF